MLRAKAAKLAKPLKAPSQRLPTRERFTRELVVVKRRHGKTPDHLTQFIANVLF